MTRENALAILRAYRDTEAQLKELKQLQAARRDAIFRYLAEIDELYLEGWDILALWETETARKTDIDALIEDYPDIAAEYVTVTTYDKLRIVNKPQKKEA